MSVIATAVKHLIAAGVTGDALVTAIADMESAANPARSKGAERTARWRERTKQASQSVTVTECDGDEAANKGFDKERFHTSKEITSQQIPDTNAGDANGALVQRICEVVASITEPLPDEAIACHDAVEAALKADGLRVMREAEVRNHDGVRGRYDLVVLQGDGRAAIEIDRRQARAKSVQKLLGFDGGRVQILRGSMPPHQIEGIDAFISLPVMVAKACERGKLPDDWEPDAKTWALADELGFSPQQAWDQLERMRDWAKNADGGKGRKSDWNAAFRNWLKRASDDKRNRPQPTRQQRNSLHATLDAIDACADEAIRRSGGHGPEGGEEDTDFLSRLRQSAA